MKKITFEEGRALALYAEFYGRCYAKWDDNVKDSYIDNPVRMQAMFYILREMGIDFGYQEEMRLWETPEVGKMLLFSLEYKEQEIYAFYYDYCVKRESVEKTVQTYEELLSVMFEPFGMKEEDVRVFIRASNGYRNCSAEAKQFAATLYLFKKLYFKLKHLPNRSELSDEYFRNPNFTYDDRPRDIDEVLDVMRMIGLIPTSMKDRELSASIEELGQKKLKKIEYILADGY